MSRMRTLTAAAATVALTVAIGSAAAADPVDVISDPIVVCQDATEWYTGELDETYYGSFNIQDASVFSAPGCDPNDYLQGDAFDDVWSIWLGNAADAGDWQYYGDPTSLTEFVVDQSTAANGDVIVLGPVEAHYGLNVQVEQRFYADGDLVRVLATYTNPTAAAITVATGTDNGYGSDDDISFLATSSGDTTVALGDSWSVLSDLSQNDPVLNNAWQLTGAQWNVSTLQVYGEEGTQDNLWTEGALTVAPGATVRLAYFSKVYGYENPMAPVGVAGAEKGLAATYIGTDIADAEARATLGANEYASFTGRLTEGLATGTVVLNWGTVGGAAPATPVVVAPAFTG